MRPHATANERNMFEQNAEAFVIFGKQTKNKGFVEENCLKKKEKEITKVISNFLNWFKQDL